jgi:hypothetical protein
MRQTSREGTGPHLPNWPIPNLGGPGSARGIFLEVVDRLDTAQFIPPPGESPDMETIQLELELCNSSCHVEEVKGEITLLPSREILDQACGPGDSVACDSPTGKRIRLCTKHLRWLNDVRQVRIDRVRTLAPAGFGVHR